jgi:YbbR domain-containing protein
VSSSDSGRGIGGFLKDAIFKNFWLKLISLCFSLGLYAFIHSAQNAQRVVRVKLVIEKPPENLPRKLMTEIPPTVDVTIVGPRQVLEGISGDDHSITLNLQAAQDIPDLELVPNMVGPDMPPRVRIDRIFPSQLAIDFEDIITRMVKVQVARTGEPAPNMEERGSPVLDPIEVKATGIESVVSTIQFARAEPFDVSGLMAGKHTRRLRLDPPPDGVIWDQGSVSATVEIARKLKEAKFENIKVEVLGMPQATVTPGVVKIFIKGPQDMIDRLTTEAIVPRVEPLTAEMDPATPNSVEVPVFLELPPGLELTIIPSKVTVKW